MSGGGFGGSGFGGSGWGGGLETPADLDLSFEEDDGAGGARAWILDAIDSFWGWAPFVQSTTPGPASGTERFEGAWGNEPYLTDWSEVDAAQVPYSALYFSPPLEAETFEVGWGNFPYFTASDSLLSAVYVHSGGEANSPTEDFESQWDQIDGFPGVVTFSPATYAGAGATEAFEVGWRNVPYDTAWGSVTSSSPVYGGIFNESLEDFEFVSDPARAGVTVETTFGNFTPLDPTSFFSSNVDGCQGRLVAQAGGALPTGFFAGVDYFVVGTTGTTFQLSLSLGGAPVVPSTTGVGLIAFDGEANYWTVIVTI